MYHVSVFIHLYLYQCTCVADVKKCPGWTPTSCGKIHEDQPGNYWMHRCNPLAIPKNDTATILSCKPQAVNGTFQCYFGQARALDLTSHTQALADHLHAVAQSSCCSTTILVCGDISLAWLVLDAMHLLLLSGAMHVDCSTAVLVAGDSYSTAALCELLASRKADSSPPQLSLVYLLPFQWMGAFTPCFPSSASFYPLLPMKCQLSPSASHSVPASTLCFPSSASFHPLLPQ